jgi:DNA-binding Lrp family transcriptional regulator
MTITQTRRHRFRRDKDEASLPFRKPTDRDREILKLVYDFRFLTSTLIWMLVGGSKQGILRRLQKLFKHGYLERVKVSNNEDIVYATSNKGQDVLTLHYGIDCKEIDWTTRNRESRDPHIQHTLLIARFRTYLTLAIRANPEMELVEWLPDRAVKEAVWFNEGSSTKGGKPRRVRVPLEPDATFIIADGDREMFYFLEADRSNLSHTRYRKKLTGYYHCWKQGKAKERFDVDGFRVLTITISDARAENLRALSLEATPNPEPSGLFWFACERAWIKPAASHGALHPVLSTIWKTPKSEDLRSMLEQ